jgi:transcriptional regulator with XRE-family HTH domain
MAIHLREYREKATLTQEQLAEKANLTAKYLGDVERGTVNISVDALLRSQSVSHARQ